MKPYIVTNKGFTLVELLVSLVIMGIVLAGIYELYIHMHKTWISQEMKAQTQQTGRVALDYIQRDLMMAGYKSKQYEAGNKKAEDKIIFATQSTIIFDRYMEAPVGQNRIIKYYVKADANGKRNLYRDAYKKLNDSVLPWVPYEPDDDNFAYQQPVIEDISLLTFKYYTMANPLAAVEDAYLATSQDNRNTIVKIEVIIQSKSTKKDPTTGDYTVLTNSITVTPVNLRTTETVSDSIPPSLVSNLNVVDTCLCSGPLTGSLKAKWTRGGEGDIAGYVLYWGRVSGTYEGSVTIPITDLADKNNPEWTITGATVLVSKTGTPNIYYVSVRAYDNSLNFGPLSSTVYANPGTSITVFGGSNDTAVNVTKPTTPPAGFAALNIADDATIGQNQIKLTWVKDTEASKGYRIYRILGSGDFPDYPISDTYQIADESSLGPNAITYTDNAAALITCQDYRYAICSVNCDETLVQNYESSDYTTLVKAPTNTAPSTRPNLSDNTRGGYKRIFVGLTNPTRSGNDADFLYTMVYFKQGPYVEPGFNADGVPTSMYTPIPESDCGVPGKFIGEASVNAIFNDETDPNRPNNIEPNLPAAQYGLLAVSHYGCRPYATNDTTATVSPSLCQDDEKFPGAPPVNGGSYTYTDETGTHTVTYGGLSVTKSGGCLYNDSMTGVETRQNIKFLFSYGGDGIVFDYAGVYVEKREHTEPPDGVGALITRWGPSWSSVEDPAPALNSDGHNYDYFFKLADCAYVNGANTTDITSDADAFKIRNVAPGDIAGQTGGKVVVFGNFSSIPNGTFYHNAVKFNIVNTADCNISIQRFDNITWDNTDAYLKTVIIGPSVGITTAYQQDVTVPGGSVLSGGTRIASVAFTTNPLIADVGYLAPSVAIPVTLVFANLDGSVDQFVDMRNTTITLNAKYTNTSTNGTCSRNGTINVSLGPVISGTVQDKPDSPTLPFAFLPGSSVSLPAIVIEGGQKVNVSGNVSDADASLLPASGGSVRLFFKTTGQGVTSIDTTGFTTVDMLNPASTLYSLESGSTDRRIPNSEGSRLWYYIVARDADGNFDRDPEPSSGYFTYDQKLFNLCEKTPRAPVLTATKVTVGLNDFGSLSWTAPTQYTDGVDIQTSGPQADTIKYDVYRLDGFTGTPVLVPTGENLTALTFSDPTALTMPTKYTVKAKNGCTDPGPNVSAPSNEGIICAGSAASCAVTVVPNVVEIDTNWGNHSLDTSPEVDLTVFICDRAGDDSKWDPNDVGGYDPLSDITMTIHSAGETPDQPITLYEVNGDSGIFKPITSASISSPTDANAVKIGITANPSLYGSNVLVQGATTEANLSDTVVFTTDAGVTSCASVSASVAVSTNPCSNTPAMVTGVTTPVLSGNNVLFSWTNVTINTDGSTINDLQKYRIYKSSGGGADTLAYEITTNSVSIQKTDFSPNVTYTLKVSAVDSCGIEGAKSSGVTFTR